MRSPSLGAGDLNYLALQERAVGEYRGEPGAGAAPVSKHLGVLRDVGWYTCDATDGACSIEPTLRPSGRSTSGRKFEPFWQHQFEPGQGLAEAKSRLSDKCNQNLR